MLFSFYLFFISIDMADLVEFDESRHRIVGMGMRAKDSAMGGHVGNYIIMIIIINKEVRKKTGYAASSIAIIGKRRSEANAAASAATDPPNPSSRRNRLPRYSL
ncbi:hypothetical protein [Bifidobacterium moukalabense]|uniref:hypothetical protein n=1 Tax=Bifidobacterium moukalabense TaxID=1333651 RepID=UPI0010F666ED|nr:hypothetical protein [Bifidobacterium moukalabense]